MDTKTVLITGGCGFLGAAVADLLLARDPQRKIILTDIARSPRLDHLQDTVEYKETDLTNAQKCKAVVTGDIGTIFHFASLVSGGAEINFEQGYNANIYAFLYLLDACRLAGNSPRVVFPSSIATFGGEKLPPIVDDYTHQHPQNSYGVAKVVGEQILNDYTRKGYVDGRGTRLPAIVVRDVPNTAASSYVSSIIREPVAGKTYTCPVPGYSQIPIMSVRRCVDFLVELSELPPEAFGDFRTVNAPGINPTAAEIADIVRASQHTGVGEITFDPDPSVVKILDAWPRGMKAERALDLGLKGDSSIEEIVSEYISSKTMPAGK